VAAVDTNVLLRLILDDDESQSRAARALMRTNAPLFVSHIVLVESTWVLKAGYRFTRDKIGTVIEMLLDTEGISVESPTIVASALASYRASRAEFSDCLIVEIAKSAGMSPLCTFDEKLAKVTDTRKLASRKR
jgi:predicted nucleic-acid-binding protein